MLTRVSQLLLVILLVAPGSVGAQNPFIGKWRVNLSRSKPTDEMKIEVVGANRYALTFGPGAVDTIVANGTDQAALQETTLSMAVTGPNHWKIVRKKAGRTMILANWTLSPDGKTLTDEFNFFPPDRDAIHLHYVYERTAGGSGILDTWVAASDGASSVNELEIQPYKGDGLSFDNRTAQITRNIKFDGSDYPDIGPSVVPGSTSSGRRVNELSLEITDKIDGKITDTREIELSPDLSILTITVQPLDKTKPNTRLVFDRETP